MALEAFVHRARAGSRIVTSTHGVFIFKMSFSCVIVIILIPQLWASIKIFDVPGWVKGACALPPTFTIIGHRK